MVAMLLFAGAVICLCSIYWLLLLKKRANPPPGPWNFFPRFLKTYIEYQAMAQIYGPIFQTKYGFWNVVILDDTKIIREALGHPAVAGRMDHKVFNALGSPSNELRRYVLRTLRDFGLGKHSTEVHIHQELDDFLQWMESHKGVPTTMHRRFVIATVNSLWKLMAGERHDQDNNVVDDIVEKASSLFLETLRYDGLLMNFPQVINILPKVFLREWNTLVNRIKPLKQIFHDAITHHLTNPARMVKDEPSDLIDSYLARIEETEDDKSIFYGDKARQQLLAVLTDLYTAGEATTSLTLTWAVLYLIRYPEVQRKMQKELDTVIGRNRRPFLSDRPKLPYTVAVIMETLRISSITPLGLFRLVTEDFTLAGYDIRKGTVIIPNLYSVHYNKKIWKDPEIFRPERFLSPDGLKSVKIDNFIPFSVGRRLCPGESMARDNIFLFMTNMYHQFSIGADPANPTPSLCDVHVGFLREPAKYSVVMERRY